MRWKFTVTLEGDAQNLYFFTAWYHPNRRIEIVVASLLIVNSSYLLGLQDITFQQTSKPPTMLLVCRCRRWPATPRREGFSAVCPAAADPVNTGGKLSVAFRILVNWAGGEEITLDLRNSHLLWASAILFWSKITASLLILPRQASRSSARVSQVLKSISELFNDALRESL